MTNVAGTQRIVCVYRVSCIDMEGSGRWMGLVVNLGFTALENQPMVTTISTQRPIREIVWSMQVP